MTLLNGAIILHYSLNVFESVSKSIFNTWFFLSCYLYVYHTFDFFMIILLVAFTICLFYLFWVQIILLIIEIFKMSYKTPQLPFHFHLNVSSLHTCTSPAIFNLLFFFSSHRQMFSKLGGPQPQHTYQIKK